MAFNQKVYIIPLQMIVVSEQGKYLDKNRFYRYIDKYLDLIFADYKIC